MQLFSKVNESIFCIRSPQEGCCPIVFVVGKSNFLINCASSAKSLESSLLVAFKKLGYNMKNIHNVIFTDCSDRTAGGAHRLREIAPGARFLTLGDQGDRLKNPTYYENERFAICPDQAPPMRELRGIFVDGEVDIKKHVFEEIFPLPTPGYSDDAVCWYHVKSKTLICGDNIQGNGSEEAGCAVITDAVAYRSSLAALAELDIETMICTPGLRGVPEIVNGKAHCLDVINSCLDTEARYAKFANEYISSHRSQQLAINLDEMVSNYFASLGTRPKYYGYAMLTFYNYIKQYL